MRNTLITMSVIALLLLVLFLCGCPATNNGINPEEGETVIEGENITEGEVVIKEEGEIVEGEVVVEGEGETITEGEGEAISEGEAVGDFHLEVIEWRNGLLWEAYLEFTTNALAGQWLTVDGVVVDNAGITRMGVNVYAQRNGARLDHDEWPIAQYGTYFDWVELGEGPLFAKPYVVVGGGQKAYTADGSRWTYDGQSLVVWNGFVLLDIYGPVALDEALSECDWCSAFEGEN